VRRLPILLSSLPGEGITGVNSNTVGLTESNDPTVLGGSTWTDFSITELAVSLRTAGRFSTGERSPLAAADGQAGPPGFPVPEIPLPEIPGP
jgi:hypothetical protein